MTRSQLALVAFVVVLNLGMALAGVGQAPAAAGALALLVCAWRFERAARADVASPEHRVPRLLSIAIFAFWCSNLYFMFSDQPRPTWIQASVLGVGAAWIASTIVWPAPVAHLVAGLAIAGVALRLASYAALPLDPMRSDMLPAVHAAARNLLAGHDPYALYQMPGWVVPLVYFPLTWLAYVPATALGVDLRLTNVLLELGLGLVVWRLARRRGAHLAPAFWAWTFVASTSLSWSINSEHPVAWLLLAITLAMVIEERPRATAISLGFAMASSPLCAVAALFIGVHWLRRWGLRQALALTAISLLPFSVVLAPFVAWDPAAFMFGVFRWHNDNSLFPGIQWNAGHTWATQVGLSGLLWRAGLIRLAKPLQALVVGALAVRFWRRGAGAAALAPALLPAYVAFIMVNPMVWGYLYWPAGVAGLLALASLPVGERAAQAETSVMRRNVAPRAL
jgi:hypothetical protein